MGNEAQWFSQLQNSEASDGVRQCRSLTGGPWWTAGNAQRSNFSQIYFCHRGLWASKCIIFGNSFEPLLPFDDTLHAFQATLYLLEAGTIRDSNEGIVAVEFSSRARIHIEENTWSYNDLFLQQLPEEAPAIVQRCWQVGDVTPT